MTKSQSVPLEKIRVDGGTQMRAELSQVTVTEYRELIVAEVEFPPIDLFYDGSYYWLGDGFHRYFGAMAAGKPSLAAHVHKGTQRDAILFAVGANQANGLRRSNDDKRKAVLTLLNDEEWVAWSDRKIADQAGVNHEMVSKCRNQLAETASSPAAKAKDKPRVGKDGKARKAPAKKPRANPIAKPPKKAVKEIDLPTGCEHEFDEHACIHCHEPAPAPVKYPSISGGTSFDVAEIEAVSNQTVEQRMSGINAKHNEMLNLLTALTKHLNQITQNHKLAGHIVSRHQSIRKCIGELRELITATSPGDVCPKCEGAGCEFCAGYGWTTDHYKRQHRSTK